MTAEASKNAASPTWRNPLSPRAMTIEDVRPDVQFLWFVPPPSRYKKHGWPYSKWYYERLVRENPPNEQWGQFTSAPFYDMRNEYTEERGELVLAQCIIEGQERVVALFDMGIVSSRYDLDKWASCITIPR